MGGSALLIYGTVGDTLLQPRPVPRSLMSRMFGGSTTAAPRWTHLGLNRRLINLPTDGIQKLGEEFRAYLEQRFSRRWAATSSVIDYLGMGVIDLHLRGDQEADGAAEWYVQLNFSGCGGMAQIASQVAAHWAEAWYREESARLAASLLRPHGFEVNGRIVGTGGGVVYVPIGLGGYASYVATPADDPEHEREASRYFEVDESLLESLDEHQRVELMRRLDSELRPLMPDAKCCCQWCSPDFDVDAIERLGLLK